MMNSKFAKVLTEFLDSECSNYGLSYEWEQKEPDAPCDVTILKDGELLTCLRFKFDGKEKGLQIQLGEEGSFYRVREYEHTVRYFWMQINL